MKLKRTVVVDYDIEGWEFRDEREKSNISLRKFATRLNVTCSYWSKVERGFATPGPRLLRDAIICLWGMPKWEEIKASAKVVTD